MAELVYAHDSKSCGNSLEGSSPSLGTRIELNGFKPTEAWAATDYGRKEKTESRDSKNPLSRIFAEN